MTGFWIWEYTDNNLQFYYWSNNATIKKIVEEEEIVV
jgi:hypothetical protein